MIKYYKMYIRSEEMLRNIINEFTVNDIQKSIEFYKKYFNFKIEDTDGNPITWVQMKNDNTVLMIEDYEEVCREIKNFPNKTNTSNLIKFKYDNHDEVREAYRKLKDNNIELFMELKQTEYGTLEFGVFDLDRNMIIISA